MRSMPACSSCQGSGAVAADFGAVDCPDCGGSGFLPARHVLVDWRARDLEKSLARGAEVRSADVTWMLAELRQARAALVEIVALAHDVDDADDIARSIRHVANKALGLYEAGRPEV
jgi:hypothetical protein